MISAVLLAAGTSSRMKGRSKSKLLLPYRGLPLAVHAARTAAAVADELIVVLGRDAEEIRKALYPYANRFVLNEAYEEGQGTSVACGTRALASKSKAAFFLMGDQPRITTTCLRELIARSAEDRIVVPVFAGRRASPCLFGRDFYAELGALTGGRGGRAVMEGHPGAVLEVSLEDPAEMTDVDTEEDYLALCRDQMEGD